LYTTNNLKGRLSIEKMSTKTQNSKQKLTLKSGMEPSNVTAQIKVPVAQFSKRIPKVGLRDMRDLDISWLAGYTLVGNGTLGATDGVYFTDSTAAYIAPTNSSGDAIPVAPGDAVLGATYIKDILKHFQRMTIKSVELNVLSINPSTSNSMTAAIMPAAGAGTITQSLTNSSSSAGPSFTNVIGSEGAILVASWESARLDLTKYIRGGSGPKQNDFQLGYEGSGSIGTQTQYLQGVTPCGYIISGINSTTALRATKVHALILTMKVDLFDFVAGETSQLPFGINVEQKLANCVAARLFRQEYLKKNQIGSALSSSVDKSVATPQTDPSPARPHGDLSREEATALLQMLLAKT
jgi:hypothetical protein